MPPKLNVTPIQLSFSWIPKMPAAMPILYDMRLSQEGKEMGILT